MRTAVEALAAVLGGTQSLHTNSYDEALALPTEEAVTIALRTQQMLAHETGVTNTVDPLGGSYFLEALTDEMEQSAYRYFAKIDELGGMVAATKSNYPQREIADASFALQQEIDGGERVVVGVNRYLAENEQPIPTLRVDPELERKQLGRLQAARSARDGAAVERSLASLREHAAHEDRNLMEPLLDCARAHASEGEIVESLQQRLRRLHRDPGLLIAAPPTDGARGVPAPAAEACTSQLLSALSCPVLRIPLARRPPIRTPPEATCPHARAPRRCRPGCSAPSASRRSRSGRRSDGLPASRARPRRCPPRRSASSAPRPARSARSASSGSRSGRHSGHLRAYTSATGESFLPSTPFQPNEHVSVHARWRAGGRTVTLSTHFKVAQPVEPPQGLLPDHARDARPTYRASTHCPRCTRRR